MADRTGWTKEPASSRAGWTKEPVAQDPETLDSSQRPAQAEGGLDFLKPDRPAGSMMAGIQQGATLGFGDEMTGAAGVVEEGGKRVRQALGLQGPDQTDVDPEINPNGPAIRKSWGSTTPAGSRPVVPAEEVPKPNMAEVYRQIRDRDRSSNQVSEKSNPGLYSAGEMVGTMAVPIPGSSARGASLAAKMGRGALQTGALGVAVGAGKSDEEGVGGVVKDALINGAVAAPIGAAGAVAGHAVSKLADRFGGKATALRGTRDASIKEGIEDEARSLLGEKRSATQAASRDMEVLARQGDPRSIPVQARINRALDAPESQAFGDALALNKLESMPERMSDMTSKGAKYDAFKADAPAELARRIAEQEKKGVISEAAPRLKNYATRILPPVIGSAIGAAVSDDKTTGGMIGATAGGVLAATMGAPGTAFANMMKSPAFQIGIAELKQGGTNALGAALGKFAPVLAAQKSKDGVESVMSQLDPQTLKKVQEAVGSNPNKSPLEKRFGR